MSPGRAPAVVELGASRQELEPLQILGKGAPSEHGGLGDGDDDDGAWIAPQRVSSRQARQTAKVPQYAFGGYFPKVAGAVTTTGKFVSGAPQLDRGSCVDVSDIKASEACCYAIVTTNGASATVYTVNVTVHFESPVFPTGVSLGRTNDHAQRPGCMRHTWGRGHAWRGSTCAAP